MSVVREDVWSREDSAEVIFERRVAYRTKSAQGTSDRVLEGVSSFSQSDSSSSTSVVLTLPVLNSVSWPWHCTRPSWCGFPSVVA